ncbi:hypothetical protein HDU96_009128, partial [Phlyctochytrium bullatum]
PSGTLQGNAGQQWLSVWAKLHLKAHANLKDVMAFIDKFCEMIDSYGRIYTTDKDQHHLLDLLVSKFSSNTQNTLLLVNTTGSNGFLDAQLICPAPANRYAQGVAGFKRQIENALMSLQSNAALNKHRPIATLASRASTSSPDSGQGKGKKNSNPRCLQPQCRAQKKIRDESATGMVSKKKTHKTPVGSSTCSLSGKKHDKSYCPILREILKAERKRASTAKITEIEDDDAMSGDSDQEATLTSRKTASAKKASNSTIKL